MKPEQAKILLNDIIKNSNIVDWDVIIVTDGSGSKWRNAGGWAAIIFHNMDDEPKVLYGAFSDTTINICELFPVIYSLIWFDRNYGIKLRKQLSTPTIEPRNIKVHVISDCEAIVKQGNGIWSTDTNKYFYYSLYGIIQKGYDIEFHWLDRNKLITNRMCDMLSKELRIIISNIEKICSDLEKTDGYKLTYIDPTIL